LKEKIKTSSYVKPEVTSKVVIQGR
jgi:hypothetical protein